MAEVKAIAKRSGQLPNRTWVAEGEEFSIDSKLFSERWMTKVKVAPKKAAKAETKEQ